MEEKVNSFQTDDSLKKEKKYKDDYNTFITKLKNNKLKLDNTKDNQTLEEISSKEEIQKNWNQFNNTKTTYSINKYTTDLNKDEIPEEVKEKAERIEKAILESDTGNNEHIIEERYNKRIHNKNEEEKYSSVIRQQKTNEFNKSLFILAIVIIIVSYYIMKVYLSKSSSEEDDNDFD